MPRPRPSTESSCTLVRRRRPTMLNPAVLVVSVIFLLQQALPATAKKLRGQLSPSELAKRDRERRKAEQCLPANQEFCGNGQGTLVCEFNDDTSYYASRCVKKNSYAKHVALHEKNYCGACHKCFQNANELQSAVHKYVVNGTAETSIAKIYGWPIGSWCVDQVTDFSQLFAGLHDFNEDIGGWDVRRATTMAGMFMNAFQFDQDLSDWNTERVKDMSLMFDRAYSFSGSGLSQWNTSRVSTLQRTFRIAKKFSEDLSAWNTAQVTDMSLLFYRAESFDQPMANWNVEQVTDLSYSFAFAREFNQSLASWRTTSATTTRGMFQSADSFAQDLRGWDVARVTDTSYMFSNALAFDQNINSEELLQTWNMSLVRHRDQMFGVIAPSFNQTSTHPTGSEQVLTAQATSAMGRRDQSISSF
ncbi:(LipO)protein [Seminavis robusta]|uniref:(LipO)protein n=1 Tax=Seminavis robusta TaxID=568900 RepID=A0A9N8EEW8_9STRA|nr:(LipO)protein [Seminavis robusta]|eukprot:Sro1084_g239430.1 (LipO)protein (417) ;mRNA; r:1627-2877